jgi:hypothetical protein
MNLSVLLGEAIPGQNSCLPTVVLVVLDGAYRSHS